MSELDPSHSDYRLRRHGMDHERYRFETLQQRSNFCWPNGSRLAVCIIVNVEFFPLDQQGKPFKVPGGMTTAYPDLRHFSLREYGNRIGIYRVLDALRHARVNAAFAVNGELARRMPLLVDELAAAGEIIAHGLHMDALHATGVDPDREREYIKQSTDMLRQISGQAVTGWLSPAKSQSLVTPDLLKQFGIQYCCDWVNDELPYQQITSAGQLTALPLCTELEDRFVIQQNLHSEESWAQQVCDAFDFLQHESTARKQARLLTLNVHAWLIGQPHRISAFERVLAHLKQHADKVAFMQPAEVVQAMCETAMGETGNAST